MSERIVHYLDESHLLLFLIQVILLLGLSRALGLFFQRHGQPAITAEILVGLALGPTVLGRLLPEWRLWLFPPNPVQHTMLDTVGWLGILFFLLHTGLETDFSAAWRQRKEAALISLSDLVLPMAIAFLPCMFLPQAYMPDPSQRVLFGLFVATIMTISALPVTARILQDLNIYRTDVGLLIMCALTINDVAGWVVFAVILGFATGTGMSLSRMPVLLGATLLFAAAALTLGKQMAERAFRQIRKWNLPDPGSSLTLLCLLGMIGGAITLTIGIHALFGFFVAGIMAGEAKSLSENTRRVISQMVRAVLVPLFFATIGLRVDFLGAFDPFLVLFILVVGIGGRYLAAWLGVRLSGKNRRHRHLIAAAHVPGGEMQIVIGMLALEFNVITDRVFVAIVTGAIVSTVILGPWMGWLLRRKGILDIRSLFSPSGIAFDMQASSREEAIKELCLLATQVGGETRRRDLADEVLQRESLMGTGLGHGIATPHARSGLIQDSLVIVGRSRDGIEWNALDNVPARLVFLILTPAGDAEAQLRVLRTLATSLDNPQTRHALLAASDRETFWSLLGELLDSEAQKQIVAPGPSAPGESQLQG